MQLRYQLREDIDCDCGVDKSLVKPDFPDNIPLKEEKLPKTVNRNEVLREQDGTPLSLVPPTISFQPLKLKRRYLSSNKVQHCYSIDFLS